MPRLLVINLVKNIEVRENKWHPRNQRKIPHLVTEIKERQQVNVDLMLKEELPIVGRKNNLSGQDPLF